MKIDNYVQLEELVYEYDDKYIEIGRRVVNTGKNNQYNEKVYMTEYDNKGNIRKSSTWYALEPLEFYNNLKKEQDSIYDKWYNDEVLPHLGRS